MTAKNVIRFITAILASWIVAWLGRGRLSEPLAQGLAFWVMFLILPLIFTKDANNKKSRWVSQILVATVGALVYVTLNTLLGGWREG